MHISLSAFAPDKLSCETGSAVPSRVSLLISILRLNLVLTYVRSLAGFLPSSAAASIYFFKTAIRHRVSPEFIGPRIAYRWRSLPRVRRHRASKPQGSSERVLPRQITMDQSICASLSHTHYRYQVGMLKVPAYQYPTTKSIGRTQAGKEARKEGCTAQGQGGGWTTTQKLSRLGFHLPLLLEN